MLLYSGFESLAFPQGCLSNEIGNSFSFECADFLFIHEAGNL